jgi:DNA-binding response OmpR family regulator
MDRSLEQVEPRRNRSRRRMAPSAVVLSRSLLFRDTLCRRLAALGVEVSAFAGFQALARELDHNAARSRRPDLILIDGDGWELAWEELVRQLGLRSRGVSALLLVSALSVGQALETPSLGIESVILKPFKAEEHTARVYDRLLDAQGVLPERAHPRYRSLPSRAPELEFLPEGDWVPLRVGVEDISSGGARLELPSAAAAAGLVPGRRVKVASLVIDGSRIGLAFRVVYRGRNTAGIEFERLEDRQAAVAAFLGDLDRRVFGGLVPRRPW